MKKEKLHFTVREEEQGQRLDKVLASRHPERSRQYFQKLLRSGIVLLNGKAAKASGKLKESDVVQLTFPPAEELDLKPAEIDLDILYEDDNLMVLDKPAGLVVHPGEGQTHIEDSLVNALLHHYKGRLSEINGVLRPGIVHRLDKDTSGLLVVAKNDTTHRYLVEQFQERHVEKYYYALLVGRLEPEKGVIEAPIGRDPTDRKKMAVVPEKKGKMAVSRYEVIAYYGDFTYVKIQLVTGRTHQIRVHFASIGYPLAGDNLYGNVKMNRVMKNDHGLTRQFLHAAHIAFMLPGTQKKKGFETPLPHDLELVLSSLKDS